MWYDSYLLTERTFDTICIGILEELALSEHVKVLKAKSNKNMISKTCLFSAPENLSQVTGKLIYISCDMKSAMHTHSPLILLE